MLPSLEKMSFECHVIPKHRIAEWKYARDEIVDALKQYRPLIVKAPNTPIKFNNILIHDIYNLLKNIYPYVPMIRNCPNMGYLTETFENITHKIPWIYHRNVLSQSYDESNKDRTKFLGFTLSSDVMFEISSEYIRSYEAKTTPLNSFLANHITELSYWIESTVDFITKGPENIMEATCLQEITYLASCSDTIWREVSLGLYDTINAMMAIWINNDSRAQQAYIATQLLYNDEPKKYWADIRKRLLIFIDCYHSQSTNASLPIDTQLMAEIPE